MLHYLGLDHAGHTAGPRSTIMRDKQREMDGLIRRIHRALQHQVDAEAAGRAILRGPQHRRKKTTTQDHHTQDQTQERPQDPTRGDPGSTRATHAPGTTTTMGIGRDHRPLPRLLVICSDHGMNEQGNHGGASEEETSAMVMFVPVYPSSDSSVGRKVKGETKEHHDAATVGGNIGGEEGGRERTTQSEREIAQGDAEGGRGGGGGAQRAWPPRTVSQLDILPTLALMMGVESPAQSVGRLLLEPLLAHLDHLKQVPIPPRTGEQRVNPRASDDLSGDAKEMGRVGASRGDERGAGHAGHAGHAGGESGERGTGGAGGAWGEARHYLFDGLRANAVHLWVQSKGGVAPGGYAGKTWPPTTLLDNAGGHARFSSSPEDFNDILEYTCSADAVYHPLPLRRSAGNWTAAAASLRIPRAMSIDALLCYVLQLHRRTFGAAAVAATVGAEEEGEDGEHVAEHGEDGREGGGGAEPLPHELTTLVATYDVFLERCQGSILGRGEQYDTVAMVLGMLMLAASSLCCWIAWWWVGENRDDGSRKACRPVSRGPRQYWHLCCASRGMVWRRCDASTFAWLAVFVKPVAFASSSFVENESAVTFFLASTWCILMAAAAARRLFITLVVRQPPDLRHTSSHRRASLSMSAQELVSALALAVCLRCLRERHQVINFAVLNGLPVPPTVSATSALLVAPVTAPEQVLAWWRAVGCAALFYGIAIVVALVVACGARQKSLAGSLALLAWGLAFGVGLCGSIGLKAMDVDLAGLLEGERPAAAEGAGVPPFQPSLSQESGYVPTVLSCLWPVPAEATTASVDGHLPARPLCMIRWVVWACEYATTARGTEKSGATMEETRVIVGQLSLACVGILLSLGAAASLGRLLSSRYACALVGGKDAAAAATLASPFPHATRTFMSPAAVFLLSAAALLGFVLQRSHNVPSVAGLCCAIGSFLFLAKVVRSRSVHAGTGREEAEAGIKATEEGGGDNSNTTTARGAAPLEKDGDSERTYERDERPHFDGWSWFVVLEWIGQCGFFALGNSHTLATIDFAGGAYTGVREFSQVAVGGLAFAVIFTGPLLALAASPCLYVALQGGDSFPARVPTTASAARACVHRILRVSLFSTARVGYDLVGGCAVLFAMRYHLFVWTVFAPNFMVHSAIAAFHLVVYVSTGFVVCVAWSTWDVCAERLPCRVQSASKVHVKTS